MFKDYLVSSVKKLASNGQKTSSQYTTIKHDSNLFSQSIVKSINEKKQLIDFLDEYSESIDYKIVDKSNVFLKWKILDNKILCNAFNITSRDEYIDDITQSVHMTETTKNIFNDYISNKKMLTSNTKDIFSIINLITDTNFQGGDLRTLSVQLFMDFDAGKDTSKRLESLLNMSLNILSHYYGESVDKLKKRYHLSEYPVSIACRGNFNVERDGYSFSGLMPPHTMLHPENIDYIKNINCKRVLTIENKTSFERYTREVIDSDTIVIFTHGYPNSGVINILKKLSSLGKPFHHWGDIDVGGILIALTIEKAIGNKIHIVGVIDGIEQFGTNATNEYKKDKRYHNLLNEIKDITEYEKCYELLSKNIRIEQENVEPNEILKQLKG